MSYNVITSILLSLSCGAGVILEHPRAVTVNTSEIANFTCAINCSENLSLRWSLTVPELGVLDPHFYNIKVLKRIWWKRYGIKITNESTTSCDVTINILATNQLNGTVVQCEAYGTRASVDSYYSKSALLLVMDPEPETGSTNTTTSLPL